MKNTMMQVATNGFLRQLSGETPFQKFVTFLKTLGFGIKGREKFLGVIDSNLIGLARAVLMSITGDFG